MKFMTTENVIVIEKQPIVIQAEVSAYTASVEETDSEPLITASGARVRKGLIACPAWLEFGTRVEINGEMYDCQDVMNLRYRYKKNFDIFMETKEEAKSWGRKQIQIKIYQ